MRIISDFKDYYDTAQGFGIDPALVYVRKLALFEYEPDNSIFASKKRKLPDHLDDILRIPITLVTGLPHELVRDGIKYRSRDDIAIPIVTKVIGFCGHLFPAIEIDGAVYASLESMVEGLSEASLKPFKVTKSELHAILSVKRESQAYWYRRNWFLSYQTWELTTKEFVGKRYDEVFVRLGTPVFKVEYAASNKFQVPNKIRCTLNPALRRENFQKVKGPAEAFQEISMYLGNQLARQPDPMGNVSDEIMRDQKGFDEWSFRRHKEDDKKRLKRKRRQDHPN